jgi:hypothetical protein
MIACARLSLYPADSKAGRSGRKPITSPPSLNSGRDPCHLWAKTFELIDFAPSALSLLCRPVPAQMQGRVLRLF